MCSKLFKIFVFLVLASLVSYPGNSFAFKSLTRDQMVYDAIEFCPAELKSYLRENLPMVSAGMHFKERHRHGPYEIDPYDMDLVYQTLIQDLKAGRYDDFNTAHAFGVLACFLAETISPDDYKTPNHLIPEDVVYDGYHQVEPAAIKSYVTHLIEDYRIPCRQRMKREITDKLYNVAVNEIADFWVTAWESSGHHAGLFANVGQKISHKNLVLNFKVVG